jgi:carbon monoxide dehydrogenase subunit G
MIEIEAETTVDAPPETVFEFLADPKNHPKILPSLVEISNVGTNNIGKQGRYVFKMVGQAMEGQFTDIEFDRPNRRAYELTGDIVGTVTWSIEGAKEGAHVVYQQETEPLGPDLLETVTEPIAKTFLQREADTMIENLRTLVEQGVTDTS